MNVPAAEEEQYLKPGEAAKLLHVSPKTIDRWALSGRIPCIVTLGGHRRFRIDHVLAVAEAMANSGRQAAKPEQAPKPQQAPKGRRPPKR